MVIVLKVVKKMGKRQLVSFAKYRQSIAKTALVCAAALAFNTFSHNESESIFSIQNITLPHIESATQIIHKNRTETGGFSALWASSDCNEFIFVSDYSQVNEAELKEQPVKRSGWYHTQNEFDKKGNLIKLDIKHHGVLKHLNSKFLKGAAESIAEVENGFVMSFDDTGDLWLYEMSEETNDLSNNMHAQGSHPLEQTPTIFIQQPNFGEGNAGLESIANLGNGLFLSVWEKFKQDDKRVPASIHKVSKFNGLNTVTESKFTEYTAVSSPKDLAVLNDGTVLVLEKDWLGKTGSRLRISEIDITTMKQINHFDQTSDQYDNFEGMASCTMNQKEWLFIVSDDNGDWPRRHFEDKGIPRQRTLLIGFDVASLLKRENN